MISARSPPGQADRLLDDWKKLLHDTRVTTDPAYLRHHGKPLAGKVIRGKLPATEALPATALSP